MPKILKNQKADLLTFLDDERSTSLSLTTEKKSAARILVVDDNADMRQYLARLLATHYQVEVASDGEAALAIAHRNEPDLIVLDVMMPKLDGFAVLKELRADPGIAHIAVIMLSARADEESRIEGIQAGADDYLVKPFSARLLLASVSAHLQMTGLRQKTNESIRESEERLRSIIAQMPAGVGVMDKSGHWVLTNALMEHHAPKAIPSAMPELLARWKAWDEQGNPIPPENWPSRCALRGETVMPGLEMLYINEDQSEIWTRVSAAPLRDKYGEILGATVVVRDITSSKQAQDVLRRNAETFVALVEQSPLGIYTVDSQFCIRNVSAGARPKFRNVYPLIGSSFVEVMHTIWPESVANEMVGIFRHTLNTGEPYVSSGMTEKRKDIDAIESYEWQINRVTLADGQEGVVCYFFDATRLMQAHQAVRKSEEYFRALANATSDVVYHMDPNWSEMHYLKGEDFICDTETINCSWLERYTLPEDRPQISEMIIHAIQTKSIFELEHRVLCEDGSNGWVYSRAIPICGKDGEITEWFGAASDVTRRKNAEQALVDASKYKDQFIAILSHELRNPLAPLRNGLQILRLAKGNANAIEKAQVIMERQLAQMVRLIDDLLDLNRINHGKLELQKQRVELIKVIQHALEMSYSAIETAGHNFEFDTPSFPIYVDADFTRLAQVFANLLHNAAKYTEEGGQIRLSIHKQSNDQIVVSVSDNGVGIPAHMLSHVFEMYAQIEQPVERSQGGLGIGLSLVKQLVEMHGGTVEVKSKGERMGSEFIVILPMVVPLTEKELVKESNPTVNGCRILVADDNYDVAKSLAIMLELMGNVVKIAKDGLEAVAIAAAFQPDLILLDIGMPLLNGYDTAREIRKHPWGRDVTLVALTGWGQEKFIQIRKNVEHHAQEEEIRLFPMVKELLDRGVLKELGREMQEYKAEFREAA